MFDLQWELPKEGFFGFFDDAKADAIIREWVHGIADYAENSFHRHLPAGPYTRGRMAREVTQGRVNKTVYGYTVDIGIRPVFGLKYGEDPRYPKFVDEGTGNFGPNKRPYGPLNGNVMVFEKAGEGTIFTRFVEGQRGQGFSEKVHRDVDIEVTVKKAELAILLSELG